MQNGSSFVYSYGALRTSVGKHGGDVAIADRLVGESKSAVLPHLLGSAKKGAERGPRKSAADADSFDTNR